MAAVFFLSGVSSALNGLALLSQYRLWIPFHHARSPISPSSSTISSFPSRLDQGTIPPISLLTAWINVEMQPSYPHHRFLFVISLNILGNVECHPSCNPRVAVDFWFLWHCVMWPDGAKEDGCCPHLLVLKLYSAWLRLLDCGNTRIGIRIPIISYYYFEILLLDLLKSFTFFAPMRWFLNYKK